MKNKKAKNSNPFKVFKKVVKPVAAPDYINSILMIKGGPKGDMDREDR